MIRLHEVCLRYLLDSSNVDTIRTSYCGCCAVRDRVRRWINNSSPCGEGVYGIVKHKNRTYLAYVLELPELPGIQKLVRAHLLGEVQHAMNIEKEGSFVISVKVCSYNC